MIDTRDLWQIKRMGTTLAINLGEPMALKFRRPAARWTVGLYCPLLREQIEVPLDQIIAREHEKDRAA
jgi:hypothetical protein